MYFSAQAIFGPLHPQQSFLSFFPFADNLCNFETDLCNWDPASSSNFKWERTTGQVFFVFIENPWKVDIFRIFIQEIIDNAGHGPLEDADGYKVRHFVNVDAKNAKQDGDVAEIRRLFRASEHPEECFSFSFNLEVSILIKYSDRQIVSFFEHKSTINVIYVA